MSEMTLPPWAIEKLGMEFQHEANYTLADGLKSATGVYAGEIEWHGAWRPILVAEIESDPLIGMVMMRGCRLMIDVIDAGEVSIVPLKN